MGLFTRAEEKNIPDNSSDSPIEIQPEVNDIVLELDEAGQTLRSRILRIPPGANVPYTALSLLRAYGSFRAGICLYLEDDLYRSYASVGLGLEKINFPSNDIFFPEKSVEKYFRLDPPEKTVFNFMDPEMDLWCFPLDNEKPWGAVLLLGCIPSAEFDPKSLSLILDGIQEIINPRIKLNRKPEPEPEPAEQPPESEPEPAPEPELVEHLSPEPALEPVEQLPPEPAPELAAQEPLPEPDIIIEPMQIITGNQSDLLTILEQYHLGNEEYDGFLIDIPAEYKNNEAEGVNKIKSMVSHFALAEQIAPGRCLILMPKSSDRDLIIHRIKNSLNTGIPLAFDGGDPAEVLRTIQPFI